MKTLDGSKEDEKRLKEVFEKLGFTVVVHLNLKFNEITSKMSGYGTDDGIKDHKGKAFVFIILSHGNEGDIVYAADGKSFKVHELQKYFHTTSCESLAGVPKVFLIDACRGEKEERHPFLIKAGANQESSETRTYITDSSDFITVFASTHGNQSYVYKKGGEKKGSCFTQTLVEVIEEADEDIEFNEIIREVRFRVQQAVKQDTTIPRRSEETEAGQIPKKQTQAEQTEKVQTVQSNSTLMRPYYIKRLVFLI